MVLTPAVAGATFPAVFAGAVAPADFAGTDVLGVAEKEFLAIAEGCSLADDAEGSPLVIRVGKQLRAVVENNVTVPEPIENSVDERPSEGSSSPVDIVTVPEPMEHSDVRGAFGIGTTQDVGEAIVMGAVGSAAPWFLTGWADGVVVEFMIDMGCQVTILATSVFERMCVCV